jgi:hypothetical protein
MYHAFKKKLLYEIFKVLKIQKRIVSVETIHENMIFDRGTGDLNDFAFI